MPSTASSSVWFVFYLQRYPIRLLVTSFLCFTAITSMDCGNIFVFFSGVIFFRILSGFATSTIITISHSIVIIIYITLKSILKKLYGQKMHWKITPKHVESRKNQNLVLRAPNTRWQYLPTISVKSTKEKKIAKLPGPSSGREPKKPSNCVSAQLGAPNKGNQLNGRHETRHRLPMLLAVMDIPNGSLITTNWGTRGSDSRFDDEDVL